MTWYSAKENMLARIQERCGFTLESAKQCSVHQYLGYATFYGISVCNSFHTKTWRKHNASRVLEFLELADMLVCCDDGI